MWLRIENMIGWSYLLKADENKLPPIIANLIIGGSLLRIPVSLYFHNNWKNHWSTFCFFKQKLI